MRNILIMINNLKKGGAERVVSLFLKDITQEKDIKIHLLMIEDDIEYDFPQSITPVILSTYKRNGIFKLLELPFFAFQLKLYIKKYNIDTVMSFLYRPNYINILAKIFGAKHKSIINIRSTTSRYQKEGVLGKVNLFLVKSLFNKADLIISNSKGVDLDLKSILYITTKNSVIYNPIDIEYINSKKNICEDVDFNFKKNKKYIISVGRLIPLKRNKDLIDAFYNLQKYDNYLELIFVGDGILKNNLIKYCCELGISKKVNFLGNVSNPFYYLNNSTLFVMNSEIEGFPNALIEAMACELPVISSDCRSGPREILDDENYGYLYPVGNVEILMEKMKIILYDDINLDKIRSKNLERLKEFEISKIMNQFKELL